MAVEAQLCPQCGAAITFGATQTEVVCGHCGTTVVKAAAAPAVSGERAVAKEVADEKLIQETVGREHKLRSHGQPASAKIVSAQATDVFRATVEGRAVLMTFTVEVQPEGEAAFAAETKTLVGLAAVDKYQAGTLLDVRYDPQDHAQVSVEGRHGVPSSNPEAQARQRQAKAQAKEQARRQAQQAKPPEPAAAAATEAEVGSAAWWRNQAQPGEPAAPAEAKAPAAGSRPWGGPPAGKGHAVPVPEGFETVTSLGPAAAVYRHDGLRLPHLGPPRPSVLVLYHDGLAFQVGKEAHAWRWDEVTVIQSNVWQGDTHDMAPQREYTLTHQQGDKVILDNGLKDIEHAIDHIKQMVFGRLFAALAQAYNAGQAQSFGPVTVHKQNGLQLDGKAYAWDTIQDIKVKTGRFTVTLRGNKKHEAHTSNIPNIELLGRLIGVEVNELGLWYWTWV